MMWESSLSRIVGRGAVALRVTERPRLTFPFSSSDVSTSGQLALIDPERWRCHPSKRHAAASVWWS